MQAAAETLAAGLTTSTGGQYTVMEADEYLSTSGNGQTRDWSYKYTNYAFSVFLDNDRFGTDAVVNEQISKMQKALESFLTTHIIGQPVVWTTDNGGWRGESPDNGKNIEIFHSIPFAAPPVGNLRFRKPQAVGKLEKINNAQV